MRFIIAALALMAMFSTASALDPMAGLEKLGNGYCRNVEGERTWRSKKSCAEDLVECKTTCATTKDCACMSFSANPTNDHGGCKSQSKGRCVMYIGLDVPTQTGKSGQEYETFRFDTNECTNQCLDEIPIIEKTCVSTRRPVEYLEVSAVEKNAPNPGYYFEFDEAKAKKYFAKSPSWNYKGEFEFVNSCGDTLMLEIIRNGKCDDTGDKMQCGRMVLHASVDDWLYKHVGQNVGQKRWIALTSKMVEAQEPLPPMHVKPFIPDILWECVDQCLAELPVEKTCVSTPRPAYGEYLQVWPVVKDTTIPGYFFEFDKAKAEKFFGKTPSWKFMGEYEMLNSCGDTYMLKIIRNSNKCDHTGRTMQCGRILAHLAHPGAKSGDWNYKHVGENIGQKRWIAFSDIVEVVPPKVCVSTPRPANYLEVYPVTKDTKNPGYYFKFSDAKAIKYFGTKPTWKYMGEFEFLNSCGDTQMLTINRKSGRCDDTSNTMECGRILGHADANAGKWDWTYKHVGEGDGQKRWIALASRINEIQVLPAVPVKKTCVSTPRPAEYLEVWPVTKETNISGYFFEFSESKAKKFFGQTPSWNYKGEYEMINSCGDTYMLKIIRNSNKCDNTGRTMQCGRILAHGEHPGAKSKDWLYKHVGENVGQKRWIGFPSSTTAKPKTTAKPTPKPTPPPTPKPTPPPTPEPTPPAVAGKVCVSTSRPAEYLEVKPVFSDTTDGYYFEFDDAMAKKYFGTKPTWKYMGQYEFLNSCGDTQMLTINRKSGLCDSARKMECGRILAHINAKDGTDDWAYTHVGQNIGQKRWIALTSKMGTAVGQANGVAGFFDMKILFVAVLAIAFYGGYVYGNKSEGQKYEKLIETDEIQLSNM